MFAMQPRLEHPRGRRALRLLEQPRFRAAYDLLLLRAAGGHGAAATWRVVDGAAGSLARSSAPMASRLAPARSGAAQRPMLAGRSGGGGGGWRRRRRAGSPRRRRRGGAGRARRAVAERMTDASLAAGLRGIGSNLGRSARSRSRAAFAALRRAAAIPGSSRARALYRTRRSGRWQQADFINAVAGLLTQLAAARVLAALRALETALGRAPARERWGPRTLDLDLLVYGEQRHRRRAA